MTPFPRLFFALSWIWLGFFPAVAAGADPVTFSVQPIESWVRPMTPPAASKEAPQGDGIDYLLVDSQENVASHASYYHEVRSIYSESGVQNGSALTVSFDPSYQKLTFHVIRVIRDKQATDRLDPVRIKLFQRESEMDYFLYDGTYTAQCQLEDIRIGDVIEFSYTVEGSNPVLQGHFGSSFATNWGSPVHRAFTRLIYPSSQRLYFKARNKEIEPVMTTEAGQTEWVWDEQEVAAKQADGSLPDGYSPYGVVQVTDFESWSEVVEWALPLYGVKNAPSPELEAKAAELREIADKDRRVLAALRFVQEEIRYLGIEIGPGSHQPADPGEVLRRRFGDCKDKTQLLATLLREAGIEVTPALVNTTLNKEVENRLPSVADFNHVILRVVTPSGVHWLDSTRSQQRGPLSQIRVGDYGYALVLRLGETELTKFSPPAGSAPRTKIVEKYRIAAPGEDAWLDVTTEYRGLNAERNRSYHHDHDAAELDKQYLKYFARRYPGIQIAAPHGFAEIPGEEGCVLTEHYRIPKIWTLNPTQSKYVLSLFPQDLYDAMGETVSPQRDDPLAIKFPTNIIHEIHADMFEDWPLTGQERNVKNDFFHFEHHTKSAGKYFEVNYSFEILADRVPVPELVAYNTALNQLKDALGYTLSYSTPEQLAAEKLKNPDPLKGRINWLAALIVGGCLLGTIYGMVRLNRRAKRMQPPPLPESHGQSNGDLEGLRGWLVLVGLGVCVRPFVFLSSAGQIAPSIFKLDLWHVLTTPGASAYHPLWGPGLLFEFTLYSAGTLFGVYVAVLFFKKRSLLPACLIAILAASAFGGLVDSLLCLQIPAAKGSLPEATKSLTQNAFAAAIWIPYLLFSRRVKNTFRR